MEKVPKMISTKDLSYISDMFNWNITAYNKINLFLPDIGDKELKSALKKVATMHKENCKELVNILKGSAK